MSTLAEDNDAKSEEQEMQILMQQNIRSSLGSGIVKVVFEKSNGEMRTMYATLKSNYLPEQTDIEETIAKRNKSTEAIAVWDIEKEAWRSFRWDSIKSYTTGVTLVKDEVVYT